MCKALYKTVDFSHGGRICRKNLGKKENGSTISRSIGPVSPALAPISHGNAGYDGAPDVTPCPCRCECPNSGGFHEWALLVVVISELLAGGIYLLHRHFRRTRPVQAPLPPPPAPTLPLNPATGLPPPPAP